MPEFKKGPFSLLPNPPYEELALHNEVFQIWPSGEIFTSYEYIHKIGFVFYQLLVDNMPIDYIITANENGLASILERVN